MCFQRSGDLYLTPYTSTTVVLLRSKTDSTLVIKHSKYFFHEQLTPAYESLYVWHVPYNFKGVARTPKKLHTSKGATGLSSGSLQFSKWERLLKKRICSQRDQILFSGRQFFF